MNLKSKKNHNFFSPSGDTNDATLGNKTVTLYDIYHAKQTQQISTLLRIMLGVVGNRCVVQANNATTPYIVGVRLKKQCILVAMRVRRCVHEASML